jgi:outer membrane receptor protein involved in Fe transport
VKQIDGRIARRTGRRTGAGLLFVLLSTSANIALAQTLPPSAEPEVPAPTPPQGGVTTPTQDIIVTGSRIARKDYTAESPTLTMSDAQLARSGAPTLEQALNQLPQFTASFGQASAFPSRGGQAFINLRGLGTNRALVLLDGRRIVPSNADGTIDTNILPQQLIANVETITGGASTAYGSDAMAGVVNFRLRQNFTGVQLYSQIGVTDKGDGSTYDLSGMAGTAFADGRGHAIIFFGYTNRQPIYRGDRAFFTRNGSTNLAFLPQGLVDLSSAPPSQAAVNTVFAKYGAGAGTVTGKTYGFNPNGTLFTAANNPIVNYQGAPDEQIRFQNNTVQFNSGDVYDIQIPLQRYSVYGMTDFRASDAADLYLQGNYVHYTALVQRSYAFVGGQGQTQTIPVSNPFIPADLKTLLASRANPTAPFIYRSSTLQFGPRQQPQDWTLYQITGGVKGTIPGSSITYDVYGSYGHTRQIEQFRNGLSFSALTNLLNAPDGGASLCAGGFNPFGNNPVSASCSAYLKRVASNETDLSQTVFEGTVQGPMFNLPAGSARFAAGAEYRRNSYATVADPLLSSGDSIGFGISGNAHGSDTVKEVYGELLLPIIHDTPLIQEFNLDLAARYSSYRTIGGVGTYKADFDWKVFQPLRLRGGYSRAVRAPSLGDLYGAPTTASVTVGTPVVNGVAVAAGDPCDVRGAVRKNAGANAAAIRSLCLAQGVPLASVDTFQYNNVTLFTVDQGNPNLKEEKADTFSIGGVLTSPFHSPFASHLSVSVDYYSIKISNAIGLLGLATSLNRCFSAASNPTFSNDNIYCQQLPRKSDGFIATGLEPLLNQASFKTAGIDGQLDWRLNLAEIGGPQHVINLNLAGTYVLEYLEQDLPGATTLDYAGTTGPVASGPVFPKFRSIASLGYDIGNFGITAKWRHMSGMRDFSTLTNPASTIQGVPAYDYFDASVRFEISRGTDFQLGVLNIADKQPPLVGTAFGNTDQSTYDVVGRRFYVSVHYKF